MKNNDPMPFCHLTETITLDYYKEEKMKLATICNNGQDDYAFKFEDNIYTCYKSKNPPK